MNERENRAATAAHGSGARGPTAVVPEPQPLPHAGRFRLVYALLALAAVGVIGVAVHTATSVRPAPPAAVKHRWHPAGATTFALAKSIAHHYTAARLEGFEAEGVLRITAQRPATWKLGALQIPTGQVMAQVAVLPTDVVYQLCGHARECSLLGPPSVRRELLLRRLTLQLAVDTFAVPHPPKQVLVSLPALPGHLWLAAYSRDEFSDTQLAQAHALLKRMAKARRRRLPDVAHLDRLTDERIFSVSQQAVTEDQQVVFVLESRPCMDAACPGNG